MIRIDPVVAGATTIAIEIAAHKPMRPKAARSRISEIEAGRGIAACMVVAYHVAQHVAGAFGKTAATQAFQFGHAGVDFFFVISGFIILFVHHTDVGTPPALRNYLRRRFIRLMPTYWVALACAVILATLSSHTLPSISQLFTSAFLLPVTQQPLLSIAWTLQHEVVFYAVFAVMILNRGVGLLVLALWASIITATVYEGHRIFGLSPAIASPFNGNFFLGMAVAFLLLRTQHIGRVWMMLLGIALFALAATAEVAGAFNGYSDIARIYYGYPSAVFIFGAVAWSRGKTVLLQKWLMVLGRSSYSIYLFQFFFIGLAWKVWLVLGPHAPSPFKCLTVLVASAIVGGILVSRRIEYPLMRWAHRRLG